MKNKGGYDVASCLFSFGADLNHQDITGRTALHTFFNETVRTIVEFHYKDIDNESQDSHGKNITHYVSWSKSSFLVDLDRCSKLNEATLETVDKDGRSLLHFACQRGNLEIIERFLNGKDTAMSQPDWKGRTLLHYATESGRSAQAIEILVQEGFDVHAKDDKGRTVLHHAASVGNLAAVKKLLVLGAAKDLSAVDTESRTPLRLAVCCGRQNVVDLLRSQCIDAQGLQLLETQETKTDERIGTQLSVRPGPFLSSYHLWALILFVAYLLWAPLVLGRIF